MPVRNVITLYPGSEVAIWHVVFHGASAHTTATPDALGDVQKHAPPMFCHGVVRCGFGVPGKREFPGNCSGGKQEKYLTTIESHFVPPAWKPGLCG